VQSTLQCTTRCIRWQDCDIGRFDVVCASCPRIDAARYQHRGESKRHAYAAHALLRVSMFCGGGRSWWTVKRLCRTALLTRDAARIVLPHAQRLRRQQHSGDGVIRVAGNAAGLTVTSVFDMVLAAGTTQRRFGVAR